VSSKLVRCRLCKSTRIERVLEIGSQSFTGVFPRIGDEHTPMGQLALVRCDECSLVQLADSFDKELLYGENYGYKSSLNNSMKTHLEKISKFLQKQVKLPSGTTIIDIGSNDGTFLSFFPNELCRIGIDPTINKFSNLYDKGIIKIADFFSKSVLDNRKTKKAKLITSISMMYDLENPVEFAKNVNDYLEDDGYWFFEQSYLGLMLENLAYDTICHEHLEYYSAYTISILLELSGFVVISHNLNLTNGGSIAILAAKKSESRPHNSEEFIALLEFESSSGLNSKKSILDFGLKVSEHGKELRSTLESLVAGKKKISALGASTKGNVLLQYCGIDSDIVSTIGEVNRDKLGCMTPGSNIPIVPEQQVFDSFPEIILILPWHFRETFLEKTKDFRSKGGLVIFPLPKIEIIK
jgi:hypothetical protein